MVYIIDESSISRTAVAEHLKHYFNLQPEKLEQVVPRMCDFIAALRTTPETSVTYDDERKTYTDVRDELVAVENLAWALWSLLEELSAEGKKSLNGHGFDQYSWNRLITELNDIMWATEFGVGDLPKLKGGHPVKHRKLVCAQGCLEFAVELDPDLVDAKGEMSDFAEETLRMAVGDGDLSMKAALETVKDHPAYR